MCGDKVAVAVFLVVIGYPFLLGPYGPTSFEVREENDGLLVSEANGRLNDRE